MGDKVLNTCPMTDSQSGVIIEHMRSHSMIAAHQQIGNDAESNRQFKLDKLKEKVDKVTPKGVPKKPVDQIVNNYLRQEAKKYNVNKVVFRKLTGNPVEKTFLRDDKHERMLSIVGTSHNNSLSLASGLSLPKVRTMQVPSATVQALMTSTSKKPPTLYSVMKQLQKENLTGLTIPPNTSTLQPSRQVYVTGSSSNFVCQPFSQNQIDNSSNIQNPPTTFLMSNKKSAAASIYQNTPGPNRLCTSSTIKTAAVSILKSKRLTVNHPSLIPASTLTFLSTDCAGRNSNLLTKTSAGVSILKSNGYTLNHPTVSAPLLSQATNLTTKSPTSILQKNRPLVYDSSSVTASTPVQSTQCMNTIENSCSNSVSDIGLQPARDKDYGLSSINNKNKRIMKKRQRTPANSKAQIMPQGNLSSYFGAAETNSIAKSMSYTNNKYGNRLNNRNRMSSMLAEALQKNAASFEEMQAKLRTEMT